MTWKHKTTDYHYHSHSISGKHSLGMSCLLHMQAASNRRGRTLDLDLGSEARMKIMTRHRVVDETNTSAGHWCGGATAAARRESISRVCTPIGPWLALRLTELDWAHFDVARLVNVDLIRLGADVITEVVSREDGVLRGRHPLVVEGI